MDLPVSPVKSESLPAAKNGSTGTPMTLKTDLKDSADTMSGIGLLAGKKADMDPFSTAPPMIATIPVDELGNGAMFCRKSKSGIFRFATRSLLIFRKETRIHGKI